MLARLIDEVGLPSLPRPTETHFATLVRSIVYQQLAGAAAGATDFARRAPLATVAMRPKSGVSQWTMRLVSVSGRVRKMMPVADSII